MACKNSSASTALDSNLLQKCIVTVDQYDDMPFEECSNEIYCIKENKKTCHTLIKAGRMSTISIIITTGT